MSFALGQPSVQRLVVLFLEPVQLRAALFDALVFLDELVDVHAEVLGHFFHLGRHLVVAARLHDALDELLLEVVEGLHVFLQLPLARLDLLFELLEVFLELLELLPLLLEVAALLLHELPLLFGVAALALQVVLHLLLVLDEVFYVEVQLVAVAQELDVRFFEALVQVRGLLVLAVQTAFGGLEIVDFFLQVCPISFELLFLVRELVSELLVLFGEFFFLPLEVFLRFLELAHKAVCLSFAHVCLGPGVEYVAPFGDQVVFHLVELDRVQREVFALLFQAVLLCLGIFELLVQQQLERLVVAEQAVELLLAV